VSKRLPFSFIYSQRNRGKWGGWGTTDMLFPEKNFLVKKEVWDGVLSWCKSSYFATKNRGKVFTHFHAIAIKRNSSMRNWNWLFVLPGRILSEQSPWCQIKLWACSLLCSSPVLPFSFSVSLDFLCMPHAILPKRLPNDCQGLRRTFFKICTKFNAQLLSDSLWNCIMHTWLQMKRHKNQQVYPAVWNLHWIPRYASATIYSCIARLQLLYRWQYHSRKLWIPHSGYV
jgi:hypothetical protein